jgi:type VI secretion system secreted protein VgrG
MADFALTNRLLAFTSPLGANVLLPERLAGSEGVSELFRYEIDLLAKIDTTIDPKKIVGQKVCVGIQVSDSGTQRYINGIVASFEMSGGDPEFLMYRATIVPNVWLLTQSLNTRVFQNQTVVDVVKAVLSPYGISPSDQTSPTYTPMEYCTQYRESDFDFISRLMEQHGILYYFKHTKDDHTFTIADTSSTLGDCSSQNSFRYVPETTARSGFYDFVIREFRSRSSLVPGNHLAWDYSYIQYKALPSPLANAPTKGPLGANSREKYDYADSAAAYLKKIASDSKIGDLTTFLNNIRRDSDDAGTLIVEGTSNAVCMQTGYTFTLQKHPQASLNVKYLLLHLEHTVQQLPPYRTRTQAPPQPYENSFTAIPSSIVYRPPIRTEKPVVHGMHTGKVVVPQGEDSYMDKYGRVCVQFWWDRDRKPNTVDNTLLRVAQSWAGKGWGTYYWPRVGDEVLIDFMEGDPDQPIVVGSVYNGVNMPKYDPAGQYTLSGILTRSSKNGAAANANELRFEDLKGSEQIYMNAERDYDLHVEHDWHTLVGNEQHTKITSNQFEEVDGDSHLLVKGKQLQEVDGEADLNVKGNQIVQVGGDRSHQVTGNIKESVGQTYGMTVGQNLVQQAGQNHSLQAGQNQDVQTGMNCNITAGQTINLMGGMSVNITGGATGVSIVGPGGFISITDAGIAIMGTMVMINSGGGPTPANPAQPQTPSTPGTPTAPTAPTFPGDDPYSKPTTSSSSGTASPAPAAGAGGSSALSSETQQAQQAAQQAQQALQQTQQAAQQAEQQAQQGVNQVTQEGQQAFQQAAQSLNKAEQAVNQASAQGQAAAQQALSQAQKQVQQTAQAAAQGVQQAQQQANQIKQQMQQSVQQAEQQAQQAEKSAQQAGQQAMQQGQQAAKQAQQQVQQASQQAQQAAQQAQQTAQQAQKQAQQAQQQVTQAGQQSIQQAQQTSQAAQQSANQAISQAQRGI